VRLQVQIYYFIFDKIHDEKQKKIIKIIAFGNSLTVGLQIGFNGINPFKITPYTEFLEKIVSSYLISKEVNLKVKIINIGVSGEHTDDMLLRIDRDVINQKPHYVIIIGGTNDIGWYKKPNYIFQNLKKMYEKTKINNIEPVACTIPSILGFDEFISPRIELNEQIRNEANRMRLWLVDLFSSTAEPNTNRLLDKYSSDGLHLNTVGYKKLAETLFDEWLKRILDLYNNS